MMVGRQLSADVEEAGREANKVIFKDGVVEVASTMKELVTLDEIEESGNDVTSFEYSKFIVTSFNLHTGAICLPFGKYDR
jgi:hypothetical protein